MRGLADILIKSTWRGLINPHPRERAAFKSPRAVEYRISITRSFVNSRPFAGLLSVEAYRHNVAGDPIRRILIL